MRLSERYRLSAALIAEYHSGVAWEVEVESGFLNPGVRYKGASIDALVANSFLNRVKLVIIMRQRGKIR